MVNLMRRNRGGEKTKKMMKTELKYYTHRAYGCIIDGDEKKKVQMTEVSKYCRLNGKSKDFIALERGKYLSSINTSEMGGIG